MPGSINHHHNWVGGYARHVLEVCNNALLLDATMPLPLKNYTKDDLILAAYFHDIDKVFLRYTTDVVDKPTEPQLAFASRLGITVLPTDSRAVVSNKIDAKKNNKPYVPAEGPEFSYRKDTVSFTPAAAVCRIVYEAGIALSDQALHAITFHEGGWSPAMEKGVVMQPLAVILHSADLLSSVCQNGK
jgi:hypothetical protein